MKKFAIILAVCAVLLSLVSCGESQGESWDVYTLNWLKDNGVDSVSTVKTDSLEELDCSYQFTEAESDEEAASLEVTFKGEKPSEFGNLYIKDLMLSGEWALLDSNTVVSEDGYSAYTFYSDASQESGKSAKCLASIYAEDNLLDEEPRFVLNFSVDQLLNGAEAQEQIQSFVEGLGFTKNFYGDADLGDVADWFIVDMDDENTLLAAAIDLDASAESSLLKIVDTENFTVDQSSVDFHGTFIRGSEKNADGNVAASKSFGNYGVYYMYITESLPYYEWPSKTVSDFIHAEGFKTAIPSLDGLFTVEETPDSIILRALDSKMHGYAGSLDREYYDLLSQAAEDWTVEEITTGIENTDEAHIYEACSTETIDSNCVKILFGNIGSLKEFYFEIKTDRAIGPFPSDLAAELANETWGFETVVPTADGDKWGFGSDSTDELIALHTTEVDAISFYKYLMNFSDSLWNVEIITRQTTGGRTIPAAACTSLEKIVQDETEYVISVFFYQIELDQFDVQISVKEAPSPFNTRAIEKIFNESFGFTTTVPAADGDSWQPSALYCSDVEYFQVVEDFETEDFTNYVDKFDPEFWDIDVIKTVAYGFRQTIARCVSKETVNIDGQDQVVKVVSTLVDEDVIREFNVDVYLIPAADKYDSDAVSAFVRDPWEFDVEVPAPDGDSWYFHECDSNYYWQYTDEVDADSLQNYLEKFDPEAWSIKTSDGKNSDGAYTADCYSLDTVDIDGVSYEIWVHTVLTEGTAMDVTVNIQEHRVLFPTYEINEIMVSQGWTAPYHLHVNGLDTLGAFFYDLETNYDPETESYEISILSDEDMSVLLDMLILDDYGGSPFTDQFEDRQYEAYNVISYYPCYYYEDGSGMDETKPWAEITYDQNQLLGDAMTTVTFTIPKAS